MCVKYTAIISLVLDEANNDFGKWKKKKYQNYVMLIIYIGRKEWKEVTGE